MNFLNAITLFGHDFDWQLENALFWLLIVQVALVMFMVLVFAVLIHRVGNKQDSKKTERILTSISLDTSAVTRTFDVDSNFDCSGLIVTANYSVEPIAEQITEFNLISADDFAL